MRMISMRSVLRTQRKKRVRSASFFGVEKIQLLVRAFLRAKEFNRARTAGDSKSVALYNEIFNRSFHYFGKTITADTLRCGALNVSDVSLTFLYATHFKTKTQYAT